MSDAARILSVRRMINITDTAELADVVIDEHLTRADIEIGAIAGSGVDATLLELAKKTLAAYFAYQAYCDRVYHEKPGVYNSTGDFVPIGPTIERGQNEAKLNKLWADAKRLMDLITDSPDEKPMYTPVFAFVR